MLDIHSNHPDLLKVWVLLYEKHIRHITNNTVTFFSDALKTFNFSSSEIPDLANNDTLLGNRGWSIHFHKEPIIPTHDWFTWLAEGIFPVTQIIRT